MSATRSIPPAEWEAHKADISALYLAEKKTLSEVMTRMENIHGFRASKAQYVRKLKQWRMEKNLTCDKWKFAATQIQKRKLEGKDTQILINSEPISAKRLKRETLRYARPQFRTREEPVDIMDGVIVHTPPAEVVGYVEYTHIPWFQFQDLVESYIKLMSTPIAPEKLESLALSSGSPIPITMDVSSDFWDLSNLMPWGEWDSATGVAGDPIHGLFQSTSSDQSSLDRQPTLGATRPASSPALEQLNRETRRLLVECLDEPIDPDSPEYVSKVASSLEKIAVESHSGELVRQVQKLYGNSTLDASFQLLRYAVYLSSNNMLPGPKTDMLLAWVIRNKYFWVIEHMIEKKTPTTEVFAANLFISAARLEEVDALRALLAGGVDPNSSMGTFKKSALDEATKNGNTLLVKVLLNSGANPNILDVSWGRSPLEVASIGPNRNLANAKLLIDSGANLNGPISKWESPTLLTMAVTQGDIDFVHMFLGAGARVNKMMRGRGSALQAAARCGNIEVAEVLLNAGADVDGSMGKAPEVARKVAVGRGNYRFFSTPLQFAAMEDNIEMVQIFLEAGADVNDFPTEDYVRWLRDRGECGHTDCDIHMDSYYTNDEEEEEDDDDHDDHDHDDDQDCYDHDDDWSWSWKPQTALQAAISNNNIVLVRLLLSHSADVNAMGGCGTALQIASEKPERLRILQLLLRKGADVNSPAQVPTSRTALQAAAGSGDEQVIEHLLSAGAEVNAPPNHRGGRTAVQAVAESGNFDLVKLLVDAGADINAKAAPRNGRTCLQAAAGRGDLRMVNLLLRLGAHVNAPASAKRGGRTALQAAIEGNHVSIAEILLEQGADANGPPSPDHGVVALCAALGHNRYELAKLLLWKGADPNGYPTITTPLEILVGRNAVEMVRCLIMAGADANRRSRHHRGPLANAAIHGNIEMVRILIDAKANIHDKFGAKALWYAVCTNFIDIVKLLLSKGVDPNQLCSSQTVSTLGEAVERWAVNESMVHTLLDHGAEVNVNDGEPLRIAAGGDCVQAIHALLGAGADVNLGPRGEKALKVAVCTRNTDLVTTLLDSGAEINAPPSPKWGRTPLQVAVQCGDVHMVQLLLLRGADVNGPAGWSNGATALQIAAARGNLPIALMLLKKGADVNAAPAAVGGRTALDAAAEHGRLDLVYLLLQNDKDEETIEVRCKQAAEMASSEGHLVLAKLLREWKRP